MDATRPIFGEQQNCSVPEHGGFRRLESNAPTARWTQIKEENGGAWLRNAGPRHTSGVNTQNLGFAGREEGVSDSTGAGAKETWMLRMKASPKSGLKTRLPFCACKTDLIESQKESLWVPCPSESAGLPLA